MKKQMYEVREFSCTRDPFQIRGKIYYRKQKEKVIPVIISHGFMGNQREGAVYAAALAELGYAVFTYDFVGGTTFGKSDGTLSDMTIFTEKADLRAVMDYVKSCSYVDYSKLVLAGCSQGGFVSGLVAVDYPEEVRALILLYPALCIPDDARKGKMQAFTFDPSDVPDVIEAHGKKLNGDYARLVMDMDAVDVISEYPGSVLLLGGQKDSVVRSDYIYRLYGALRHKRNIGEEPNARIQLWMLKDAGHGFRGKMEEMVARRITLFMRGYDEILTINVDITGSELKKEGLYNTSYVSFEADCDNTYFRGKALPGAMDVQKRKLTKIIEYKADYIMRGKDYAGEDCDIHIINRDTGNGWEPVVETNSLSLAYLNQPECCTIAENGKEGLVIHILAKANGPKKK